MSEVMFALAKQSVYRTVQGEGRLLGFPSIFVRFAGCSVGCQGCDTNYSEAERVPLRHLITRISQHYYGAVYWLWLTGGEPTDQELAPLIGAVRQEFPHLRIALATSGVRKVRRGTLLPGGVDFLSVSPHTPMVPVQATGDQVNLVPGLNGLRLEDIPAKVLDAVEAGFPHRYVTPCAGKPSTLQACIDFVQTHHGWRLGTQAHVGWGLP